MTMETTTTQTTMQTTSGTTTQPVDPGRVLEGV